MTTHIGPPHPTPSLPREVPLSPYSKAVLIGLGILTLAVIAAIYAISTPVKYRNIQPRPLQDPALVQRANQVVLKTFSSAPFFGIPKNDDIFKQQALIFDFLRTHPYQVHDRLMSIAYYIKRFRADDPQWQEKLSLMKTLLAAGAIAPQELLFNALIRNLPNEIITLIVDSEVKLRLKDFPTDWGGIDFTSHFESFMYLFYRVVDKHFASIGLVKLFLNALQEANLSKIVFRPCPHVDATQGLYRVNFRENIEIPYLRIIDLARSKNSPELLALFPPEDQML